MTFFEELLILLVAAIVLLQVSRRLALPYPAMLALAGVGVAFVPGAPTITFDPHLALVLFIAPALLDAAYDLPAGTAWRLWRPLVMLAVVAVLVSAAAVAWVGTLAGLPFAAALVLGAIVSPPDAAAATAVLGSVDLPQRTVTVLKGEALFNDATALLLFGGALTLQQHGGFDARAVGQLALAAPGGLMLGFVLAKGMEVVNRFVAGTLGGSILQFVTAFLVWIIADRLQLSAVLCVVAFAMTIARAPVVRDNPRMRVHSFAVWATVVFLLNVLAFLLMGMQARLIVAHMTPVRLREAVLVAALVIAAVVVARFAVVLTWNLLAARFAAVRGDLPAPTFRQGVFVAWCGMRGLITLAIAFALPADFPARDIVVLAAFAVVLATLAFQGLTVVPLARWLELDKLEDIDALMAKVRERLAAAGAAALRGPAGQAAAGPAVAALGYRYAVAEAGDDVALARFRSVGLAAVAAERAELDRFRDAHKLGDSAFYALQEELDWRELSLLPEEARRIEEA